MSNIGINNLFIADRMLGKLARYMRLLGYDVLYPPPCSDSRLLGMARAQGRILLTRDRGITRRDNSTEGNPVVVEIDSDHVETQLSQMIEGGWISSLRAPRCSICNTPLETLDVDAARHLIPAFIMTTQKSFLYCRSCNMVLWEGSHWRNFHVKIANILLCGDQNHEKEG